MAVTPTELIVLEPESKEFRKANSAVSVRVKSGPMLSLLARRLFNVMLYYTQHLGSPGVNAPQPWPACQNPEDYYWIPLPDIANDAKWGSKDHKAVITTLQQLQTTLVESDDPSGRFSSVQLVGSVQFIKGSGRRPSLVGWEFPRSTRDILSNPDFYTKLSIFHLTSLRTTGGAALYEIAKRYLTNVGGRTSKNSWQWWNETLSGRSPTEKQVKSSKTSKLTKESEPEYRYFKRDVLTPAIAEVNNTDINVRLEEIRTGRKITDLQFIVTPAKQTTLELPPGPVIDSVLLDRICAFGFTERQANEILGSTEDSFLRATLDYVELRINDKSMDDVKAPAAFFRKALKENYVSSLKIRPKKTQSSQIKSKDEVEAISQSSFVRKNEIDKVLSEFDNLPDNEKESILSAFYLKSATHQRLKINGIAFRKTIGNWLVDNDGWKNQLNIV